MWWQILIILNALVGLALFEYAWKFTARHRIIDEERDKKFPAWRRNDAQKWNKLTLYLGAVTFLPLRIFGFLFSTALYVGALKILYFGHDFNKPIPPNKGRIGKILYQICSVFNAFSMGMIMRVKRVDFDYSFWLGPNYKNEKKPLNFKQSSTIVSNHVGMFDMVIAAWAHKGFLSFLASDHT